MQKKTFLATAAMAASALLLAVAPSMAQEKVTINWFVGLGTGTNDQQIAVQEEVVQRFNESQDEIELVLTLAASNTAAYDTLSTLIASGNAPDIVGPVGYAGSNAFSGQWLDLRPLVEETGYDLTQFPEELVALYDTPEGLLGLPFAVFPSFIYYNSDLFDEAGVPYPPSEYGAPYIDEEGNELEWNWQTLADLAAYMTVDANGNDATSEEFDPTAIEQFGFVNQWGAARNDMSSWGGGEFWNAETGEVSLPENWREQAKWQWDAVWNRHFYPTSTYEASSILAPSAFASGHVAMARTHLWYTCCLNEMTANWGIAALPVGPDGNFHSTVDADTFRVYKGTAHPQEAFEVLTYLTGEASIDLLTAYGGLPARESDRESYYSAMDERYPGRVNPDVVEASLTYAVSPHHESDFPNFQKGQDRFAAFRTLVLGDTGAEIDVDAELDKLEADLQAIVDEVGSGEPAAEATAEGS